VKKQAMKVATMKGPMALRRLNWIQDYPLFETVITLKLVTKIKIAAIAVSKMTMGKTMRNKLFLGSITKSVFV
jgi:hypothetical protein